MSRIRSVHPGLWTDERFVSLSALARLLFIGIWNECDDKGSFEWSPLKLKMRLLPADNADAGALLAEIEAAGCIMRYELDGRQYGAVRNFGKYQRPKKPNSVHPQTDEVRNYCCVKVDAVENQFPTSGENSPQMEEGGGRSSSVAKATAPKSLFPEPASDAPPPDPDKAFWDGAKAYLGNAGVKNPGAVVGAWVRDHGKSETASALTRAQLDRAVEPIAFVQGCFRAAKVTAQPVVPL